VVQIDIKVIILFHLFTKLVYITSPLNIMDYVYVLYICLMPPFFSSNA